MKREAIIVVCAYGNLSNKWKKHAHSYTHPNTHTDEHLDIPKQVQVTLVTFYLRIVQTKA